MSVMEISHRSKEFEDVIQTAEADLRELLGIPANYKVMFLQGGATLQFAMLPMNLRATGSADYIVTGSWSKTAIKEAQKLGTARAAANTEEDGFNCMPVKLDLDPKAAYLHFTSNETIHGVEFLNEPTPPDGVPLVCDGSSDFISRPIDISKYAVLYAGAQKNAGPSGVTVVIVRDDMLERTPANLPVMLDYKTSGRERIFAQHSAKLCHLHGGTGIQMGQETGRTRRSGKDQPQQSGFGLQHHRRKRRLLSRSCQAEARSLMNIPFRLPSEELEDTFAKDAKKNNLIGLKGHRSVGGMRASIYNAMDVEGAQELVKFMKDFQKKNG